LTICSCKLSFDSDFPWSAELDELRKSLFKVENYRPFQLQAMNATLSGRDSMVIMPTGGGKSLCFQLPAFLSKGKIDWQAD
jgi:superfamily II DNA helicase RecQ